MNAPSNQASLDSLRQRLAAVASLDAAALDAEEIAVLGRKQGELTHHLKALASLPIEVKRERGAALNALKLEFEAAVAARRDALRQAARAADAHDIDLTMPGRRQWTGSRHPVTLVIDEIVAVFAGLGFAVALGPEIENEERNFGALNFPPEHPALDMHDTLYLDPAGGGNAQGRGGRDDQGPVRRGGRGSLLRRTSHRRIHRLKRHYRG